MTIKKSPKHYAKKSVRPVAKLGLRALNLRVNDKHVFINRYTKKIPAYGQLVEYVQSKDLFNGNMRARETDYKKWYRKNAPTNQELDVQKKESEKFKTRPLISVLVPTHNTKPKLLRDCIKSVLCQTYNNLELCIADDASTDETVREIIKEFADKDSHIKYIFRKINGHISEASNSALELASGKFVALLDHDDYLWPNALFEIVKKINEHPDAKFIYSDEDKIDEAGSTHSEPFFKPDWSPEFLRSINYITHFAVLDRQLVNQVGGFRKGYEGAQDWDLFLRASRQTDKIYHVPKPLYSWRKTAGSTAQAISAKDYAYVNQKKVLEDDIKSRGLSADLDWQVPYSMWRVRYKLKTKPLVSVIIPTKNQYEIIKQCLVSIKEKTTYKNFEIVLTDTGSDDERVWRLYDNYSKILPIRVVKWAGTPFNFSSACNYGAGHAKGEFYLFLNNDTEVITPTWIEDMVGYAAQKDVGAVGCKLYYPNGKLQHGGIILGVGGNKEFPAIAGHLFPAFLENPPQDPGQLLYDGGTRNFAAVTAACVMIEKKKFDQVKGFDPIFRIAFNDVDLNLKLLKRSYRNVYLPHVELYHHESISVGRPEEDKHRDMSLFKKEINLMLERWGNLIENDPYYHPAFRHDVASARLKN